MKTTTSSALPHLTLCELGDPGIEGLESHSPFCLKVHRALRLAGLTYERRFGARPDSFKDLNATGQVPVLLVGSEPVSDSTDILRRIEQLVPGSMVPEGAGPEVWLWEDFADSVLNGYLVAARWADERNWPVVKDVYFAAMPKVVRAIVPGRLRKGMIARLVARDVWRAGPEKCWRRFESTLDDLDARAPVTGYWLGAKASAADVAIFAQLHGLRNELTAWQRDQIGRRVRLSSYLDRVHALTSEISAVAQAA